MIFIVPVKSVFQGALTEARSSKHGAALDFDQVTKVFPDGTHALDEVSFALDRGEFVSVVGASGCGKSTLLRIASGLLPASGGSYSLADENLGYVFQDATLLPWRTVQNNVELFAELHDIPSQERAALALDAIDLVGLTGFEGHHPRRLSGGMKMRVSLARSLTLSPKLFLFDEPFAALDEMTRERMADELLRLFASENFAALFITHNLYEAVYLSTRVLVMSARPGRIVAEFEVPFGYPRSQELRFDPEFAALTGEVSAALRSEVVDTDSPVGSDIREHRREAARRDGDRPTTTRTAEVFNSLGELSDSELHRLRDLISEELNSGLRRTPRVSHHSEANVSRDREQFREREGAEPVAVELASTDVELQVDARLTSTDIEPQVATGLASTDVEPPVDPATAPAPCRNRLGRTISTVTSPLIVFAFFMGGWYFFTYVMLTERRRFLMPPPHDVLQEGFLEWRNLEKILLGTWATTQVAMTGLAIAIVLGIIFATLMSQARWVESSFYPYAVILQTIPIIALVPLIGLWFDFSFSARVIVCVMIALFPIITNTLFGLKSSDTGHHDLFTLHGASRTRRLRKLQFPAAQPAIFAGFRISAGLSVVGAIVGDFFFRKGEPGIGRLIDIYRQNLQTEQLYSSIFWSSLLGIGMFWSFGLLGTMLLRRWHESALTSES